MSIVRRLTGGRGRLSIQSKLLLMLLVTSVVSCSVVGVVAYRSGRDALEVSAFDRLQELRSSRAREVTRRYDQLLDSMVIYTRGTNVIDAVTDFTAGFEELDALPMDADETASIQQYYDDVFVPNLNQTAETTSTSDGFLPTSNAQAHLQALYTAPFDDFDAAIALDDAADGSAWSTAHARYHDYFRELVERFQYEDLLLIDSDGTVVYSAYKGVDLGTNFETGPFRGSLVAEAFDAAVASNDVDDVEVTDLERYQPSYGAPTGWTVSPVVEDGVIVGALAIQIPVSSINSIMTGGGQWEADGLGETGETYLVGPDRLMRSTSRRLIEDPVAYERNAVAAGAPPDVAARAARAADTVLVQPVETEAVDRALRGETGEIIERGYLGLEALFAYAPLDFGPLNWVIITEIETSEAFRPVSDFTRRIVLSTVAIIVAICLASLVLAQVFSRPVRRLMTGVRRVAAGDLGVQVDTGSRDEFGDLGDAFNDMSRSLQTKEELIEAQQIENLRLLHNLMPEPVARRYREGESDIVDEHQDVSVLFADIVGFDDHARSVGERAALVDLNGIIASFDEAASTLGAERVRTLRTGYLASCGLISPRVDNARRMVDLALEMEQIVDRFNATHDSTLGIRAAIHSGSVSSGLIGGINVTYDLWGDAVDVARSIQGSDSAPGIFVTTAVHERLRDALDFVPVDTIGASTEQAWRLEAVTA